MFRKVNLVWFSIRGQLSAPARKTKEVRNGGIHCELHTLWYYHRRRVDYENRSIESGERERERNYTPIRDTWRQSGKPVSEQFVVTAINQADQADKYLRFDGYSCCAQFEDPYLPIE